EAHEASRECTKTAQVANPAGCQTLKEGERLSLEMKEWIRQCAGGFSTNSWLCCSPSVCSSSFTRSYEAHSAHDFCWTSCSPSSSSLLSSPSSPKAASATWFPYWRFPPSSGLGSVFCSPGYPPSPLPPGSLLWPPPPSFSP